MEGEDVDEKTERMESDEPSSPSLSSSPVRVPDQTGENEEVHLDDTSDDDDVNEISSRNSSVNLNAHEELDDSLDSVEAINCKTTLNHGNEEVDEDELLAEEREDDDDDDEIMEIPNSGNTTHSNPQGRRSEEIDLVELSDGDDEEDDINGLSSMNSSVQPTSEMDNSSDSIVDAVSVESKTKSSSRPGRDDEIQIVEMETDPLGADGDGEGEGELDDDLEELSEDENEVEVMNNMNSMNSNAVSELDNSVDSVEEVVDDDEESDRPIVVSDTKSLAQLATSAVSSNNNSNVINITTPPSTAKDIPKEPTLVIIDTNSILSGKGPIPIQKSNVTSTVSRNNPLNSTKSTASIKSEILLASSKTAAATINIPDYAFLIEAPSFIVPYVFEQTGEKVLKNFVTEIADEIKKEKKAAAEANGESDTEEDDPPQKKKSDDYFESPVGKLLINLGMSLVQEYVQVDLLKLQRRKAEKERTKSRSGVANMQTQQSIISLKNNIEESKENNEPFRFPLLKCKNCNFKTESELVLSTHLETPHMRHNCYRCNFCKHTTKLPHEILLHMEVDHKIRPRLERAPGIHQCPHCSFEDNSKTKLTRHLMSCIKRFRLEKNLEPPLDWDTPGKLPKMPKNRLLQGTFNTASAYVNSTQQQSQRSILVQYPTMSSMASKYINQGPRMQLPPLLQAPKAKPLPGLIRTNPSMLAPVNKVNPNLPRGMIMRTASGQQVLTQPQIVGGQVIHQVIGNQLGIGAGVPKFLSNLGLISNPPTTSNQRSASQLVRNNNAGKTSQPSISITPLPRQSAIPSPAIASHVKPAGKTSFVICEICDGYIKDLDQLRNHMQWIHKVKIHPKMIYNKPPLNCQKCQFRFFTDQGLERHLLGSHGLVTSSMQEAANKGQDNGRCPLCGKVYQWKLLAHVAKDHNVTLKPAHLSYKCTVCTATFGMYKLFESHVYSAHSMNSKRNNNGSGNSGRPTPQMTNRPQMQVTTRTIMPAGSTQNTFKPLKINDEITIIPQPLASVTPIRSKGSLTITPHTNNSNRRTVKSNGDEGIEIIEIDETSNGRKENGEYRPRQSITEASLRKRNLEISICGTDSDNSDDSYQRAPPAKRLRGT